MPVGAAQAAFCAAAACDGIHLEKATVPWINQQGHFGLPQEASDSAGAALSAIFLSLKGECEVQAGKRATSLIGDFFHAPTGTFIETDERQHFTTFRLQTLELYPPDVPLGFEKEEYSNLCRQLAPRADRYRAAKAASGFGPGGRQRQRAYNDALRDLVIPAMGHPPVIRIPVLDGNGAAAYFRYREMLVAKLNAEFKRAAARQ